VADALEAMTSDRVYRKALTLDEAVEEFGRERGRQFDPKVVEALMAVISSQREQQPEWEQETFAKRIRVYPALQLTAERVGT